MATGGPVPEREVDVLLRAARDALAGSGDGLSEELAAEVDDILRRYLELSVPDPAERGIVARLRAARAALRNGSGASGELAGEVDDVLRRYVADRGGKRS